MDDGMQIIEKSPFVKSADSEDGVFCSDCGALFCRECVEDGCFFDHYSEEDEY